MARVDPASPEFSRLSKREQALAWYFTMGWSVAAIADELDENRKTVGRWLDDSIQIPLVNRRMPYRERPKYKQKFEQVVALHKQGVKPAQIAAAVGLHRATVYNVLADQLGSASHRKAAA